MASRTASSRNNKPSPARLKAIELDPYLDAIQQLLKSQEPTQLIIALAGATGRRHPDILSRRHFRLTEHPYLLRASMQPEGESVDDDLLTLVPAALVLQAIHTLHQQPEMAAIAGQPVGATEMKRLTAQVNRATDVLLGKTELVPVLNGDKTVSLKRLCTLYGAIAIHYFCPDPPQEHRFLQQYLSHVIDGDIPSTAQVTDYEFPYTLTRDGKPLQTRGVKLPSGGRLPTLQPTSDDDRGGVAIAEAPPKDADRDRPEDANPAGADVDPSPDAEPVTSNALTRQRQLISTVQRLAEQQSQTITLQVQTIDQLHHRIQQLEQQLTIAAATTPADTSQIEALTAQVETAQQRQQQLATQVETYREKWQTALADLNQIRQAMNLPPLAEEDTATDEAIASESP